MTDIVKTPQQLSQALRAYRKQKQLTQQQAAAAVGLLPKTISALELKADTSTIESLFKLLSALNLELLVQEKGQANPTDKPVW